MKKITTIVAVVLALMSVLGGCGKTITVPKVPHVPVVSENPAVNSPKVRALPSTSPKASPLVSQTAGSKT